MEKMQVREPLNEALLGGAAQVDRYLSTVIRPVEDPQLDVADFPRAAQDIELITRYLAGARARRHRGAHVLLEAPGGMSGPGFARLVSRRAGLSLVEVPDDAWQTRDQQIASLCLAQRLAAGRHEAALLITLPRVGDDDDDEIPFFHSIQSSQIEILRDALDDCEAPVIWICSSAEALDDDLVVRFDIVAEIPLLSVASRRRLLQRSLGDLGLGDGFFDLMAAAPGLLECDLPAIRRVIEISGIDDPALREVAAVRLLEGRLRSRGETPPTHHRTNLPVSYRLDLVNADRDLVRLVESLASRPRGTILFWGPPGTGKTELARHIARTVNRPLVSRRASDLLDKWVGETEKRIASMFQEASARGGVLFLDEADSFMRDRRGACRSWEVTQVNELLVQMEQFEGLFICSTNLELSLDQASFRRFDLKIKLDYLTPGQASRFLDLFCGKLGLPTPLPASLCDRLASLPNLTPGDFRTVHRQLDIMCEHPTAHDIVDLLADECRQKKDRSPVVGFTS